MFLTADDLFRRPTRPDTVENGFGRHAKPVGDFLDGQRAAVDHHHSGTLWRRYGGRFLRNTKAMPLVNCGAAGQLGKPGSLRNGHALPVKGNVLAKCPPVLLFVARRPLAIAGLEILRDIQTSEPCGPLTIGGGANVFEKLIEVIAPCRKHPDTFRTVVLPGGALWVVATIQQIPPYQALFCMLGGHVTAPR